MPSLTWEAQNALLTRLFRREEQFIDWEVAAGLYREDMPSSRIERINAMILRIVDMMPSRGIH